MLSKFPAVKNFLLIFLFVLIFVGFAYIYLPRYSRFQQLRERETELDAKITHLRSEIERIQAEKHLLENDVLYLEHVAREKLGRVEPGETVYKIVESPPSGPGYRIEEEPPEFVGSEPGEQAKKTLTPPDGSD